MEVESVFVTGANRGIGLEFVRQFVKLPRPPSIVFATYRNEKTTQALKEIRDASKETKVVLIKMDITKKEDIENARTILDSQLGDKGLNLLINNAAALEKLYLMDVTEEDMISHFTTNTVGPVMVLKEMLPFLQKSASRKTSGMSLSRAAVLNISSIGGSIGLMTNETPKEFLNILSYGTSKAALNMAMRVAALTVKDQGILVVNMCPGWVKTDMGTKDMTGEFTPVMKKILVELLGQESILTTEESISAILKTLSKLNESHQGSFLDRNGKTIPF